ncbi:MAG: universal stress protein [Chloroflexi bacterium]|nr:universal stress protein [Chloroflexota bacterium]
MYRKILVPLDGSELAERVLPQVEPLARCLNAELILLRVPVYAYEGAHAVSGFHGYATLPLPEERVEAIKEAHDYLDRIKQDLVTRGLQVSTVLKEGETSESIIEFAQTQDVDLIAMSTHGRTGLRRAIFGSVAEDVLRRTGKPVLLIRALEHE